VEEKVEGTLYSLSWCAADLAPEIGRVPRPFQCRRNQLLLSIRGLWKNVLRRWFSSRDRVADVPPQLACSIRPLARSLRWLRLHAPRVFSIANKASVLFLLLHNYLSRVFDRT